MSGYLQRLIRSVAQPEESVHPRTGSIFSPPRHEPDSPPQQWHETEAADHVEQREDSPALPPRLAQPPELAHTGPATYEHVSLFPKITSNTAPGPERQPRRADTIHASAGRSEIDSAEEEIWRPHEPIAATTAPGPADTAIVVTPQYRALIKPGGTTERRANVAAASVMRAERHSERAERQPDDIHIHIGRIEVTAVHPPAPRAPKPPDNALSLDAYLNRRNGRGR